MDKTEAELRIEALKEFMLEAGNRLSAQQDHDMQTNASPEVMANNTLMAMGIILDGVERLLGGVKR